MTRHNQTKELTTWFLNPYAFDVHCIQLLRQYAYSDTPHPTLVMELGST
jgi:hypothetical protein